MNCYYLKAVVFGTAAFLVTVDSEYGMRYTKVKIILKIIVFLQMMEEEQFAERSNIEILSEYLPIEYEETKEEGSFIYVFYRKDGSAYCTYEWVIAKSGLFNGFYTASINHCRTCSRCLCWYCG